MPKLATFVNGKSDGEALASSNTFYFSLTGNDVFSTVVVEDDVKIRISTSVTLKNLLIRITGNSLTSPSTVRTRKNGANGNLSVSIPAGSGGTFEDTVNSDSLVDGDDANYQIVVGTTGTSMTVTVLSCMIEHATVETSYLATLNVATLNASSTTYAPVNGANFNATEANVQYTIRFSATGARLGCFVDANSLGGATTVRTRKNNANGGQSLSVPAGSTGFFEDTTGTDSFAAADIINYQIVSGGKGAQSIHFERFHDRLDVTATDNFIIMSAAGSPATVSFGSTVYRILGGTSHPGGETGVQAKIRASDLTGNNFFVRISANSVNGASTLRTRNNGANGNLSVSVAANTTGIFEDTVNSDSYVIGDLVNYEIVTGGTSGTMTINIMALQLLPVAVAVVVAFRGDSLTWTVS